jgi:hypothetical protein
MTLQACLANLEIDHCHEKLRLGWEKSQSCFSDPIPFLNSQFIEATAKKYFDDETAKRLLQAGDRLKHNAAARRLIWHFHCLVVQNYETHWKDAYLFPELPVLGADARAFYLLLAISGVFHFGRVHEKLKIPPDLLEQSIAEIRTNVAMSMENRKLFGLAPHYSGWWQGFFSGRLYRLGRLTFLQERFSFPHHIYESKDHELLIFAKEGLKFNAQGLIQLPGEMAVWQSKFIENEREVQGNLISAGGYASEKTTRHSLAGWQKISHDGEPIISVHISGGEPMNTHACFDSFEKAKSFFEKYFPKIRCPLFTCDTWLLDPQLQKVMDPDSNIIRFQKRFFLAPNPCDAEFVSIRTIFGPEALKVGYENVPHTTRLQKAAAQLKNDGVILRHGLGFLPWGRPWQETH